MSMTIHTNVPATRTHGVYNRNNTYMNEAMTRVATGMKINSAKDGASVYAISERMRGQIRANDQANQNTQNDSALLKTAQGGIGNTISILNTLRERAINAANDSNLNTNRSDIATEVQQLVMQIDDNANKVKFNGRTLLNGAVDNTIGRLNSANAIENNGATVSSNPTETSTHAVYSLSNLYQWSSNSVAAAASNTALISLVKGSATNAGDTLFSVGDKITFSWRENGAIATRTLDVASNTAVSDLATLLAGTANDNVAASWQAKNTLITSGDATDSPAESAGVIGASKDNVVLDSKTFDQMKTTADGIYLSGKKNVAITDFSVSVTYAGANGLVNRTDAQEAIKFTGVQQSYGEKVGSNAVVSTQWYNGATDSGIVGTNSTAFTDWTLPGGTKVWDGSLGLTHVKFTVETSRGSREFEMAAGKNLDNLNEEMKSLGIQAVLVGKGEAVTYNGSNVTTSSGGNNAVLKAATPGLFFVADEGVDITKVQVGGYKSGTAVTDAAKSFATTASSTSDTTLTRVQGRATENATENSGTAALTFFVGGEPNFGVDVTINKMTTKALLGTTAENFASKFLTKEGAQAAISTIDTALNKALNEQTKLGAMEARLGYTSDNLTTMNENLEASDSVMRDSDVAKEMTNYMKYSVLSQAAQYMLAQAGQNAFSVLNLLQQ